MWHDMVTSHHPRIPYAGLCVHRCVLMPNFICLRTFVGVTVGTCACGATRFTEGVVALLSMGEVISSCVSASCDVNTW